MRKITIEIELSSPDLSVQKDIDFCREIYRKYRWMIGSMNLIRDDSNYSISDIEKEWEHIKKKES